MKATGIMAAALLIVAVGSGPHVARAQQPGLNSFDLQRHDLSSPGREMIQVRVELDPGVASPRRWHPGERSSTYPKARWNTRSKDSRTVTRIR